MQPCPTGKEAMIEEYKNGNRGQKKKIAQESQILAAIIALVTCKYCVNIRGKHPQAQQLEF
eukprot:180381-Ditylum_brightwellii.AAC.1